MTPEEVTAIFAKAEQALAAGRITAEEHDHLLIHYYGTTDKAQALRNAETEAAQPVPAAEQRTEAAHTGQVTERAITTGPQERTERSLSQAPQAEQAAPTPPESAAAAERAHTRKEHAITLIIAILAIAMVSFIFNGGITGLISLDIHQNMTNGSIPIDQPVIGLNITGTLYGDGTATVLFETPNGTFLVAELSSDLGVPRTDKPAYHIGDQIAVEYAPENATYYFDTGATSTPVTIPFAASVNGTLRILTSEETIRLPVIIGESMRAISFQEECVETCRLAETTGTIHTETTGDAVLEITSIKAAVLAPNTAPYEIIPLGPLAISEETTIDLSAHFSDDDGDALHYSTSASDLVDATVNGSALTLAPLRSGNGTLAIYVSDLTELVEFSIDVTTVRSETADETLVNETSANGTPVTPVNATPEGTATNQTTTDETSVAPLNETEETNSTAPANATQTTTAPPASTNATVGCDDPDPNKRPLECIQDGSSTYFKPEDIFLESKDGLAVGRLTPVGNLLIKGGIVERSTGVPGTRDWSRGHQDADGDFVPTIWIESASGDLHLRGTLTEANGNIVFEQGLTALMNDREIILALMDTRAGSITVRGNVIPYRRSFE